MRILLVSDWMSETGGSEVYIVSLKQWLSDAGDDVRLLTCGGDGPESADVRLFGTDNVVTQSALQVVNPFAASGVQRVVREFQPQAALVSQFAYHLSPSVMTALRPVPTVVSMMDYKAVCPVGSKLLPDHSICREPMGVICRRSGCLGWPHWLRDQPRYALIRRGLARAHRVVCASTWVQSELRRNGIESDVIPLPVAAPGASFHRAPAPEPVFVFVGRLSREKGVDVLLRAFGQLTATWPTSTLRIIGDGPMRHELRRLAESLDLGASVEFTGRLSPVSVEVALQDAWALVAPSTWAEPYGLTAIEAIVRGVPVVATSIGGFADTVERGVSGLLVANGDQHALAAALIDVASGRAFPGRMVDAGAVERLRRRLNPQVHVERLHSAFKR